MIKSISYDQEEIIQCIIDLHIVEDKIDCDPTYSRGNFYKGTILEPRLKYDIDPISSSVIKADARALPLKDGSLKSVIFDPPFLATKGPSLKGNAANNKINKRFGVYPTEPELFKFYQDSLIEFYRVLELKGVLIIKSQDKVSSGKQYFSHCYIHDWAKELGFYPLDLFILLAKNRLVADWQKENQKHARKFHSYFWVFRKDQIKIVKPQI